MSMSAPSHTVVSLFVALVLACGSSWADDLADVQRLAGTGDLSGALRQADRALAAKPRDAQLRFLRAVLLTDLKRDADAIAAFSQLHEDYPELPDPLNNLAVVYAGQGRLDEARAALESALRNDAGHRNARENLADIYLRLALRLWNGLLTEGIPDAAIERKLRLGRELLRPPA